MSWETGSERIQELIDAGELVLSVAFLSGLRVD
jgi:hypothetical protein